MTVLRTLQLACDFPAEQGICGTFWYSRPGQSPGAARSTARHDGWCHTNGLDLCPAHAALRSRGAAAPLLPDERA